MIAARHFSGNLSFGTFLRKFLCKFNFFAHSKFKFSFVFSTRPPSAASFMAATMLAGWCHAIQWKIRKYCAAYDLSVKYFTKKRDGECFGEKIQFKGIWEEKTFWLSRVMSGALFEALKSFASGQKRPTR